MLRMNRWCIVFCMLVLICGGCTSETVTDPPDDTTPNTIEFTINGEHYLLEVLPMAYSHSASGKTSIAGMTRPGVAPARFISIAFKLMGEGSVALSNSGNSNTDDALEVIIDGRTFRSIRYECNGSDYVLRYTDLGTAQIQSANPTTRRIRGVFSGQLAATTSAKIMCGSQEHDKYEIYPVSGTFDCSWATI